MSNYICELNANVERAHIKFSNRYGITLAGDLYTNKNLDKSRRLLSAPLTAV